MSGKKYRIVTNNVNWYGLQVVGDGSPVNWRGLCGADEHGSWDGGRQLDLFPRALYHALNDWHRAASMERIYEEQAYMPCFTVDLYLSSIDMPIILREQTMGCSTGSRRTYLVEEE